LSLSGFISGTVYADPDSRCWEAKQGSPEDVNAGCTDESGSRGFSSFDGGVAVCTWADSRFEIQIEKQRMRKRKMRPGGDYVFADNEGRMRTEHWSKGVCRLARDSFRAWSVAEVFVGPWQQALDLLEEHYRLGAFILREFGFFGNERSITELPTFLGITREAP